MIVDSKGLTGIIAKTLNYVDPRLVDHGMRVGSILFRMLEEDGGVDRKQAVELALMALLHDVGAYKTSEIDDMLRFESEDLWQHSIYGYLFLREFSPLARYADAVLFHHVPFAQLKRMQCENKTAADFLHLADRMDTLMHSGGRPDRTLLEPYRDTKFSGRAIDAFLAIQAKEPEGRWRNGDSLRGYVGEMPLELTRDEVVQYLMMLVYCIDFRSATTVRHTVTTMRVSVELGKLFGMDEEWTGRLFMGAMLHDIGKISTPVEILEKPGTLDGREMAVMKNHIVCTMEILKGHTSEAVFRLAARHHEKLDGSGYPAGLTEGELTLPERIVAVADIVSALSTRRSYKEAFEKEKTLAILRKMGEAGKICGRVVRMMEQNYDLIMRRAQEDGDRVVALYEGIRAEYQSLMQRYGTANKEKTESFMK